MSLIINQHGGKLTDKRAAEELSRELDRVGQDTDNLKENLNMSDLRPPSLSLFGDELITVGPTS